MKNSLTEKAQHILYNASRSMLVHDAHDRNAWEKKQRAGKSKSGGAATTTTRRPSGQIRGQRVKDLRPKVFVLDAKGRQLKVSQQCLSLPGRIYHVASEALNLEGSETTRL